MRILTQKEPISPEIHPLLVLCLSGSPPLAYMEEWERGMSFKRPLLQDGCSREIFCSGQTGAR